MLPQTTRNESVADTIRIDGLSPAPRLIGTCVDAPFGGRRIFRLSVARSQVWTCVRPRTRRVTCRRPVWDTRIGSTPPQRAQGARPNSGFPGVVQTWVTREGEFVLPGRLMAR